MRIVQLLESGSPVEAAELASQVKPEMLLESLDHHRMTDLAELHVEFIRAWMAKATPMERAVIASWLLENSIADLAYVNVQAEAAQRVISAVRESRDCLAGLLEDLILVTEGPDAGLSIAAAREYQQVAARLRGVEIPPPD